MTKTSQLARDPMVWSLNHSSLLWEEFLGVEPGKSIVYGPIGAKNLNKDYCQKKKTK